VQRAVFRFTQKTALRKIYRVEGIFEEEKSKIFLLQNTLDSKKRHVGVFRAKRETARYTFGNYFKQAGSSTS
jgi:hypothetical protein